MKESITHIRLKTYCKISFIQIHLQEGVFSFINYVLLDNESNLTIKKEYPLIVLSTFVVHLDSLVKHKRIHRRIHKRMLPFFFRWASYNPEQFLIAMTLYFGKTVTSVVWLFVLSVAIPVAFVMFLKS